MKERFPKGNRKPGEVMFEVQDLQAVDPNETSRKVLNGVTFNLRQGEILGIAGLMGSGRTELVTTIFGEYGKITAARSSSKGKELHIHRARDAMHKGISLVPEDRKGQGLVLHAVHLQEYFAGQSRPVFRLHAHRQRCRDGRCDAASQEPGRSRRRTWKLRVDSLSGGNQQKVVIAKWLLSEPQDIDHGRSDARH